MLLLKLGNDRPGFFLNNHVFIVVLAFLLRYSTPKISSFMLFQCSRAHKSGANVFKKIKEVRSQCIDLTCLCLQTLVHILKNLYSVLQERAISTTHLRAHELEKASCRLWSTWCSRVSCSSVVCPNRIMPSCRPAWPSRPSSTLRISFQKSSGVVKIPKGNQWSWNQPNGVRKVVYFWSLLMAC